MPSTAELLDTFNRESKLFRSLGIAYLASLRLEKLLRASIAEHLQRKHAQDDAGCANLVAELNRRVGRRDDCNGDDMASILLDCVIPVLRSPREVAKPIVRAAALQNSLRADRRVSVGFLMLSPSVPAILVGAPGDVQQALETVIEETALLRVLHFAATKADDDVWKVRADKLVKVLAPHWHFALHRRSTLVETARRLELEQDGNPFELVAIPDLAIEDPYAKSKAPSRYFERAAANGKRVLSWAKSRGTCMLAGLPLRAGKYRPNEMAALSAVGSVYHLHRDGSLLVARDAQDDDHPIGE